jgi:hypothetical protein
MSSELMTLDEQAGVPCQPAGQPPQSSTSRYWMPTRSSSFPAAMALPITAQMSSTYVHRPDDWRLALHQPTPR